MLVNIVEGLSYGAKYIFDHKHQCQGVGRGVCNEVVNMRVHFMLAIKPMGVFVKLPICLQATWVDST